MAVPSLSVAPSSVAPGGKAVLTPFDSHPCGLCNSAVTSLLARAAVVACSGTNTGSGTSDWETSDWERAR